MSKGEFDSPSKPASAAYRESWERIFNRATAAALENMRRGELPKVDPAFEPEPRGFLPCGVPYWFDNPAAYSNGCPILDEDFRTDQPDGSAA